MQGLLDTWENAFWHFVHIGVNEIVELYSYWILPMLPMQVQLAKKRYTLL